MTKLGSRGKTNNAEIMSFCIHVPWPGLLFVIILLRKDEFSPENWRCCLPERSRGNCIAEPAGLAEAQPERFNLLAD